MEALENPPHLSDEWIDQLITGVCSRRVPLPADFNLAKFREDMANLVGHFIVIKAWPSIEERRAKDAKVIHQARKRIAHLATELFETLRSDEGRMIADDLWVWFPRRENAPYFERSTRFGMKPSAASDPLPSWNGVLRGVREIGELTTKATAIVDAKHPVRKRPIAEPNEISATDQVLNMAAEVFEEHFKREAGASRQNGTVKGPFVRFCIAAFDFVHVIDRGYPPEKIKGLYGETIVGWNTRRRARRAGLSIVPTT